MDTLFGTSDLLRGPFLTDLLKLGQVKELKRGATLFHQDDPGEFVFVLTEGLIEVSVTSMSGRKSILAHCGPGEVLGEISVLDGQTRSADAVALKDCKGSIVWRRDLYAFLAKNPEATMTLIEALCGRIRNASDRFAVNALTSAPARLASCIIRLCEKWGEPTETGVRIAEPLSQSELGAFAGLARENVNRHINKWAKEGILTFDDCIIEVLDQDRLEDLAEG
ncbi:MAG: Crp/Fnr family transcriptional regulator [Silicimonas sp.]|nr:Crp/Fnr family transcriptional regulator [Silicimonas sp.]